MKKVFFLLLMVAGVVFLFGVSLNYRTSSSADPCSDSSYGSFKVRIHSKRLVFAKKYQQAVNKKLILDSCKKYLETLLMDSMFLFWDNTPWDFYGTTNQPRCGSIACGYFVTTVLKDLDFTIPRVRWAEVASETFIREFCGKYVEIYPDHSVSEIENYYQSKPGKIFIAGLDNHVGFFIHNDSFQFMHSSNYSGGIGVIKESASSYNPFAVSHYRAIGRLFSDEMVIFWMQGKEWK